MVKREAVKREAVREGGERMVRGGDGARGSDKRVQREGEDTAQSSVTARDVDS